MLRAAKTDSVNVPILRMDPQAVPRRQRLEAWQELASPVFAVSALVPDREFDAGWELCRLDKLIIARVSFSAQLFDHDPRALTRYDNDHLLLEFYEQGCGRGIVGDTPTYVDSRRIHLVDLSRRYRTATGDVRASAVVIPHAAVGYDPSRHNPYCAFPTESPKGRMLLAAFRALSSQLPTLDEADAPVLAAAFAGLVWALLLPDRSEAAMATAAAAGLASVQDFIDRHLTDAHLGVDLLCRTIRHVAGDALSPVQGSGRRRSLHPSATSRSMLRGADGSAPDTEPRPDGRRAVGVRGCQPLPSPVQAAVRHRPVRLSGRRPTAATRGCAGRRGRRAFGLAPALRRLASQGLSTPGIAAAARLHETDVQQRLRRPSNDRDAPSPIKCPCDAGVSNTNRPQ